MGERQQSRPTSDRITTTEGTRTIPPRGDQGEEEAHVAEHATIRNAKGEDVEGGTEVRPATPEEAAELTIIEPESSPTAPSEYAPHITKLRELLHEISTTAMKLPNSDGLEALLKGVRIALDAVEHVHAELHPTP